MSGLRNAGLVGVLGGLLACSACGGSGSSATTGPSPTVFSETFTGTVTQGMTRDVPDFGPPDVPHRFTIHQAGNLEATITAIGPLSTITLGLGFGVWDGTSQSCALPLQIYSDSAKINQTLAASSNAAIDACVAIYDVGNVGDTPVTYTVVVTHT